MNDTLNTSERATARARTLTEIGLRHEVSLGGTCGCLAPELEAEFDRREREGWPTEKRCPGCGFKTASADVCWSCRERLRTGYRMPLAETSEAELAILERFDLLPGEVEQ